MLFKKYFIVIIFIFFTSELFASEKNQIIAQLNNLNSLEFTFNQLINDKAEKGSCLLEFPGKLKCEYFQKHSLLMLRKVSIMYSIMLESEVILHFE